MASTGVSEIGTEIEVHRPEAVVDAVVVDCVFFFPERAERPIA